MNTEIFKQTLIESFETLKDSWVGNEDILATCVVEVSKYDSDLALDMWLYLLNANTNILLSSYKAPEITTDIMYKWHSKNSNSGNYFLDECKTVNESFLPFIDRHEDILKMWFGNTINAGFGGIHKEFSPIILACLLLSKSPKNWVFTRRRVSIEWTSFFVHVIFQQIYGFITLVVFVCPYHGKPIKIIAAVERTDTGEGWVLQGHPNMVPTL
jgi:hypothetical protein